VNARHISTLIIVLSIAVALGWDAWVEARGIRGASWCQAVRDLNAASDGLLGLCLVALVVHILCVQWFPPEWRHF
jgi:hypothetical protein